MYAQGHCGLAALAGLCVRDARDSMTSHHARKDHADQVTAISGGSRFMWVTADVAAGDEDTQFVAVVSSEYVHGLVRER